MTRVSNETLSRVLVNTVRELEGKIKDYESSNHLYISVLEDRRRELEQIYYKMHEDLRAFKVDSKPFNDVVNNHAKEVEKIAKKTENSIKTEFLSFKVMTIYVFTMLICCLVFFFVYNRQRQQINQIETELQQVKHYNLQYINFIKEKPTRIKEFEKWSDFVNSVEKKQQ